MYYTEPTLVGTTWQADKHRWVNVWSNGKILPVVRGGAEGDPPDPKDPPKPPVDPPKPKDLPEPKTFTQEEVTAIATREKSEGRAAAIKQLMTDLGITDVEEAKALLAAAKEAEQAKKTEAEKAAEAAAKAEKDAKKATAEAAMERLTARIERKLISNGVPFEDEKKLTRLRDMIKLEPDADDDAVKAAVDDLKKEMPELFQAKTTTPKPKGPPGSNPGGPPRGGGTENAHDKVQDILHKRHPKTAASTKS